MNSVIDKVAQLLMYGGPSLGELISDAVKNGNHFEVSTLSAEITKLTVYSTTAYSLSVIDAYYYDVDSKMIKQTLVINGNEKVIFDKYAEAESILITLEQSTVQVS